MLFLEDRADALQRSDGHAIVASVAVENPAAWATFRHSQVMPPSGAFRNALRRVARRMFPASIIDSDDDEVADCTQRTPMQVEPPAVMQAPARVRIQASACRATRQRCIAPTHRASLSPSNNCGAPVPPGALQAVPNGNPYRAGPGPPTGRGGHQ